jgi:uncharacterized membrane protein
MRNPKSSADVMQIRRHQPTRLEGFVDAAFAFSLTLVVISIGHIPESVPEMLHALRGIPAFAVCFLLIARMWNSHRNWGRYYAIEDATGLVLSLLLVFLVMLYVYPLRLLFSLLFAGASSGWMADQAPMLRTLDELRAAYIVYGVGFAAIALVFVCLYGHALRLRDSLALAADEVLATRMHMTMWLCTGSVATLSALLAAFLPAADGATTLVIALPGNVYILIFVALMTVKRYYLRRIVALQRLDAA